MHTAKEEQFTTDSRDVCTIVILYDDDATRTRALDACDFLVNQFWQEVELEFHWWRTDFLSDATLGTVASKNAVAADFLLVCLDLHQGITPTLEAWFESWLVYRSGCEGALMDLTSTRKPNDDSRQTETFLREVSKRGCFEYLTAIPDDGKALNILPRVNHQSIDEILGESRPPSHFGLNE